MTSIPFAAQAPVNVAEVGLQARNADALSAYYRDTIGLVELSRQAGEIVLGAGEKKLLTIEEDRSLKPDDSRHAGLFHTAFLLPERHDLARWVKNAIKQRIAVEGASDHLVSEALYLTDPEGNGIEIYTDRPKETWDWQNGEVVMKTLPLDMDNLLSVADDNEPWTRAPDATIIGHVHLRVGDPAVAKQWWSEALGLDIMAHYGPSAVFLATGGYHHHIGANSWQSAGAGQRDTSRSGLSWIKMNVENSANEQDLKDPWGTVVKTVPAKA